MAFCGAIGSVNLIFRDVFSGGGGPGFVYDIDNILIIGVVDICGFILLGGYMDFDGLIGFMEDIIEVVFSLWGTELLWTLCMVGVGEIVYISNGFN